MRIFINGKKFDIDEFKLHTIKNKYFPEADIVIYNGFETVENVTLVENDILHFIKKGVLPSEDELESLISARHTPYVHNKVKKAKVAVAGLGGLGSNIAIMLARTGIGKLLLVDFDIVEPSNLNRQCYYIGHLGMKKTEAMVEQIKNINPFIELETKCVRVEQNNIVEIFKDYKIVCEAFDKPEYKAMLVNQIMHHFPDTKVVASSGMAGYYRSNKIQTTHPFKNLFVCGDNENEAKAGQGLMAPRVNICAGHQANAILRLILELEDV